MQQLQIRSAQPSSPTTTPSFHHDTAPRWGTEEAYERALHIAQLAVQRAALATRAVQKTEVLPKLQNRGQGVPATTTTSTGGTGSGETAFSYKKPDKTPVTIADYAAQALLISGLAKAFGNHSFLGEEDAEALRKNHGLCRRVWELVQSTRLDDAESEALLGRPATVDEMLDAMALGGQDNAAQKLAGTCWVMDPVDGTTPFLRGGQYGISLALIEKKREVIGVLACPNLAYRPPTLCGRGAGYVDVKEDDRDRVGRGLMLSAMKGKGASMRPLGKGALLDSKPISRSSLRQPKLSELQFVDSANSPATLTEKVDIMAQKTGSLGNLRTEIYSSHVRYAAMALGGKELVQVRVPKEVKGEKAHWCVWDHAGSQLIYTETGGKVTDVAGQRIDFGAGSRLVNNWGVITADRDIHDAILSKVREMQAEGEGQSNKS
jgi:3'(2'), 5'-bisphosphate nucleotidase